jgi:membrane protease YdiL (CAAX protease family)
LRALSDDAYCRRWFGGLMAMRAFAWFFGLILAGLLVMAVLAYPAWELLYPTFDVRFHRVASRIGMLALLVGFILVARRLRLADRASLGYGVPRPVFLRELLLGLALGVVLMLPVVLMMVGLGLREWKEGFVPTAAAFLSLTWVGLLRGLVVAFIEETFLRGAMFTGISRESGPRVAIVSTALIYSATHFFARYRVAPEDVNWGSGFDMLAGILHTFSDPLVIADAFICLFAVGVVLGAVRAATGSIAACIGLHAGWVWIITFVRETSAPRADTELGFLLSQFDGFVGWLVLAWTLLIGYFIHRFFSQRARAVTAL